jgi:hypothetical protein
MRWPMVGTLGYRHITSICIAPNQLTLQTNNGSGGAEPEVVKFPGACHKHFRTLQQAEAFLADWKEANSCIEAKIKEELYHSYLAAETG